MINWEYECRHRAQANEPYEKKHLRFLDGIQQLNDPWNLKNATKIADVGGDLSTEVMLTKHLGRGLKGWIDYKYRSEQNLQDYGSDDDFIAIDFDPKKVDYGYLVRIIFPCYALAFEAYRSAFTNIELKTEDYCKIRKGIDDYTNFRNSIFRINAVNYFDRELCRRAFAMSPEKIVEKLGNKLEDVRMLGDGVLLVYTYELLEKEELAKVDIEVRKMLGVKQPV